MKVLIKTQCFLVLLVALGGCSSVTYKVAASTANDMGSNIILPHLMRTDDTAIACSSGESLPAAITPLEPYGKDIKRLSVLAHMISGLCAYNHGIEYNLESISRFREHRSEPARDSLIQARHWHTLAAKRHYLAYLSAVSVYPEFGEECPSFTDSEDELIWLIGAATALQALMNDAMAENHAQIPRNLAARAERALSCVDDPERNRRWWGMPQALRAVIWITIPGYPEEAETAWETLQAAVDIGNQNGVRIADALLMIALNNTSQTASLKNAIKRYGRYAPTFRINPDWKLVDAFAREIVLSMSDQLWMAAQGHRTPVDQLGTFWDDQNPDNRAIIEVDDL